LTGTALAFFGGIYSNWRALTAAVADVGKRGADGVYALGDFGAFGPHPDRVFPILLEAGALPIQGNYEESLSTNASDCHCGYTDPRDNHFAQISYDYTAANTSEQWKRWMGALPKTRGLQVGGRSVLLVHGSPRRINEFLWESTSPAPFLEKLLDDFGADVLVCTHTGLHWSRRLPSGRRKSLALCFAIFCAGYLLIGLAGLPALGQSDVIGQRGKNGGARLVAIYWRFFDV